MEKKKKTTQEPFVSKPNQTVTVRQVKNAPKVIKICELLISKLYIERLIRYYMFTRLERLIV